MGGIDLVADQPVDELADRTFGAGLGTDDERQRRTVAAAHEGVGLGVGLDAVRAQQSPRILGVQPVEFDRVHDGIPAVLEPAPRRRLA